MRYICLFLLLFSFSAIASPLSDMKKYGEGQMSVMFWDIYRAELYGQSDSYIPKSTPIALKITYLRDISKQDLIKATLEQWEYIDYKNERITQWASELERIWPNIKEGDVLIIRVHQDGSSSFYNATKKIGDIQDTEFGQAFLSIWLSEKTSRPDLRAQLIGKK